MASWHQQLSAKERKRTSADREKQRKAPRTVNSQHSAFSIRHLTFDIQRCTQATYRVE